MWVARSSASSAGSDCSCSCFRAGTGVRSHFALLIAGTLLYRGLLAVPELGLPVLLGLVALPLVAALVVSIGEEGDDEERGTRLLVVVWFLATLFLAWVWVRFTFLLVAPFALSFGVAMGD